MATIIPKECIGQHVDRNYLMSIIFRGLVVSMLRMHSYLTPRWNGPNVIFLMKIGDLRDQFEFPVDFSEVFPNPRASGECQEQVTY